MLPSGMGRLGAHAGPAHASAGAGSKFKGPVWLVFLGLRGLRDNLDTTGGGRIEGMGRMEPGSHGL